MIELTIGLLLFSWAIIRTESIKQTDAGRTDFIAFIGSYCIIDAAYYLIPGIVTTALAGPGTRDYNLATFMFTHYAMNLIIFFGFSILVFFISTIFEETPRIELINTFLYTGGMMAMFVKTWPVIPFLVSMPIGIMTEMDDRIPNGYPYDSTVIELILPNNVYHTPGRMEAVTWTMRHHPEQIPRIDRISSEWSHWKSKALGGTVNYTNRFRWYMKWWEPYTYRTSNLKDRIEAMPRESYIP